ncbi:MAG: hypothetical protein JWN84_1639, partial [Nocardioides sp.]|nr:hypothetical protein [Nocardioides sp.]
MAMRPDKRALLHSALVEHHLANGGVLPNSSVRQLSEAFGISPRQVRRHVGPAGAGLVTASTSTTQADDTDAGDLLLEERNDAEAGAGLEDDGDGAAEVSQTKWWDDTDATDTVLAALGGSSTVAAAHRQLVADGVLDCSYARFTVQLNQHVPPAIRAALTAHGNKMGREAFLENSIYCTETVPYRNKRWQADSQEIPLRVRGTHGRAFDKMWMINFIDEATRVVVGFTLTVTPPNAELVKATLIAAITGRYTDDGQFYGGLPEAIKWDNGKEFLNQAVTHACISLGIIPMPVAPHSGFAKGKIERFHHTIQRMFFANLKGAVNGPKTYTGQRPWRGPNDELSDFKTISLKTESWVEAYNTRHVHSSLGCPPMQAWADDPVAIRLADIRS